MIALKFVPKLLISDFQIDKSSFDADRKLHSPEFRDVDVKRPLCSRLFARKSLQDRIDELKEDFKFAKKC